MRARAATDADRDRFNAFVAASPHADVLQAWEWGEVKRRSGWTPRRFIVEDAAGAIVTAAQVLSRRPVRGAPPLLYAPRGPLLNQAEPDALHMLVDEIRSRAGGAFALKCDPPVEDGSSEAKLIESVGFAPAPEAGFGGVQPKAVMVLDLAPAPDELLAGFHSKWRYNIRVAERKGVEVAQVGRDRLRDFYELLVETARRDGFLIRTRTYFETLFDCLEPAGSIAMFLARFESEPVAGAICMGVGPRLTYVYGASSNQHRNVMPNHLMQWHMIRWAREHGYRIYDFRGVSPLRAGKPVEEHLAGLNRFKEGFGARYVEYAGTFDLPLRPLVYRAWRWGAPIALNALKRFKRGRATAAAD
jgi:lipid II:glycine glycyltransferase (peptidoglycan interpeptide bridge formation enzyme)